MNKINIYVAILFSIFAASATCSQQLESFLSFAESRTKDNVTYDGTYTKIKYPNGDVDSSIGVCSDLVVRSYRAINIDLQQLVHEDMLDNFNKYPNFWDLKRPDSNIDHRRVPNLMVFFKRHGSTLPITGKKLDYNPGDLVTWNLRSNGSMPHIGIVSTLKSSNGTPLIIHNIGSGPEVSDILFRFKITGHYRYKLQT